MDTATLRDILLKTLTDEELTAHCYDHWREVYDAFANGMSRAAKVQRLIEHADRRGELGRLRGLVGSRMSPSPAPANDQESTLLWQLFQKRTQLLTLVRVAEERGGVEFLEPPLRQWVKDLHNEIHALKDRLLF